MSDPVAYVTHAEYSAILLAQFWETADPEPAERLAAILRERSGAQLGERVEVRLIRSDAAKEAT